MVGFSRVSGFDWDEGNSRKSSDKHSVSQSEAEQIFTDPRLFSTPDERHSLGEPRFHALGMTTSGRLLQVTFTLREDGAKIHIISARAMNRKERAIYESEA
jgi:uncharacterized DUF497 family protein